MRLSTIRKVEDILRDYSKIDKYIEDREQELRYPVKPADDNVGGGKAQYKYGSQTLDILITIDDDRCINTLRRQQNVITDCLDDAGKDTEVIINELYFRKRPQYTIDGLIANHLINVSRRNAFRLKNSFIKECAKGFGLYDID
ncbi:transcriptional regulator [Lactiplantibacillus pentosus]|uniref:transcriptional regulator n=1 Tax=Lactiplantibacillus pentosus TaxID=1589 RepID=UPI001B29C8C4|nr:transcriptional regulator [Lactiplantibacillus pentosus]GIP67882.1 transcriptional regulator [Lactiplantibacillus pentosus]